jgi:hypothetical protein
VLSFHPARSTGDEIVPFLNELRAGLPHATIWAGDGCIDASADPLMGEAVSYGRGAQRFWFVFPMHGSDEAAFAGAVEPMGPCW